MNVVTRIAAALITAAVVGLSVALLFDAPAWAAVGFAQNAYLTSIATLTVANLRSKP